MKASSNNFNPGLTAGSYGRPKASRSCGLVARGETTLGASDAWSMEHSHRDKETKRNKVRPGLGAEERSKRGIVPDCSGAWRKPNPCRLEDPPAGLHGRRKS